ncbi:MAG: phage head spike fiber domain-containing protein [Chloroflexota bacterium]
MFSGQFPASLPRASVAGYRLALGAQTVRTNMETGTARVRRRTTARDDRLSVSWRFTDAEMRLFRAWYESQIGWSLAYPSDATGVSGWANTRSGDVANALTAPDGTATATYLRSDATAGDTHYVQRANIGIVGGTTYCLSVYARAGERTVLRLNMVGDDGTTNGRSFNLATGALGLGDREGLIEDAGGGWYRCSILADPYKTGGATSPAMRLVIGETDQNDNTFDGQYRTGTAQAGGTTSSIKLDTGASATTDFYNGATVTITGGTGSGQSGTITAYNGVTKVATVGTTWAAAPNATSTFSITDGIYVWGANVVASDKFVEFMPTRSTGEVDGHDGGAAWSLIPVATGDGGINDVECRMNNVQAEILPGLLWTVSAELEVR